MDVNAGGVVAKWLIDNAHDVTLVSARDPRMSDEEILKWAFMEESIVVTTAKDFEEMIWHQGKKYCGIPRPENLPRKQRRVLLCYTINRYAHKAESGAIIVAPTRKFRFRHPV